MSWWLDVRIVTSVTEIMERLQRFGMPMSHNTEIAMKNDSSVQVPSVGSSIYPPNWNELERIIRSSHETKYCLWFVIPSLYYKDHVEVWVSVKEDVTDGMVDAYKSILDQMAHIGYRLDYTVPCGTRTVLVYKKNRIIK